MTEAIRVECENCGRIIKAPTKYQGKRVKCPKCAHRLTIPKADEEPEFFDDIEFYSEDYEDYDSDDEYGDALSREAAPPRQRPPKTATANRKKKNRKKRSSDSAGGGMFSINGGVIGGLLMMVIAVAWFVLGWMGGRIFFYPPVMFVIGLVAFFKGLFGSD